MRTLQAAGWGVVVVLGLGAGQLIALAQQEQRKAGETPAPQGTGPVELTAAEDHQRTRELLKIAELRRGGAKRG
jgi:uncharacterized protein HemX